MKSYVGFVIFILIAGFIVYLIVASGGFSEFFSFSLNVPYSPPATSTTKIGGDSANVVIRTPETPFNQPAPAPTPPPGFTVSQLSPYYQKIKITGVNRGYVFGGLSSITISASNPKEPVNITGWRVDSNKGAVLEIPKGVADYNANSIASERDIVLNAGDYLNIYDAISAIGFNLRLNKCTGYLNNSFAFKPELPRYCPGIDRNEVAAFSGRCQSYIFSLGSCRQPTSSELNSFSTESACRSFLDTLNYGGCYNRHRADADFFSREWRVSLGSKFNVFNLDREHDRVMLFDRNGLLVDLYIY